MPRKTFAGHLSKPDAVRLLKRFKIKSSWLTGTARRRSHGRKLPTMNSISDPFKYFEMAMRIELEHGSLNPLTDVTKDGMLATAKIAAAHLLGVEHGQKPEEWKLNNAYYDVLSANLM
jgi:hypothetical protein